MVQGGCSRPSGAGRMLETICAYVAEKAVVERSPQRFQSSGDTRTTARTTFCASTSNCRGATGPSGKGWRTAHPTSRCAVTGRIRTRTSSLSPCGFTPTQWSPYIRTASLATPILGMCCGGVPRVVHSHAPISRDCCCVGVVAASAHPPLQWWSVLYVSCLRYL